MKTAEEWWNTFRHGNTQVSIVTIPDILRIQSDALRHAESIAREIRLKFQSDEGFHISNALEQEAIKVQNEFIARNDSQANKPS